jgi:hypothetical protein
MRSFVTWKNIERYRELLTKECDAARRQTLEKLLAEEEQVWAGLHEHELHEHEETAEPTRRPA